MAEFAIRAEALSKQFQIGRLHGGYRGVRDRMMGGGDRIWAVRDVSFEVGEGEVVGIVGRNGAGKSTLLKILSRITEPTSGYADIRGRVGSLLEVGTGFHGELTGRENVYLNGTILGMRRGEIRSKFDEIVEFSGVEQFIDTPVKRYSSGMYVRLAFAVAAYLEPEILIVDEVLSVGDAAFQKRCLGKMGEVSRSGRTVLFVSHNMQAVRQLCSRAILLESGRKVLEGGTEEVVRRYLSDVETAEPGTRRWAPHERPGDDDCRLAEVRVCEEDGTPGTTFFSSRPIAVELEVDVGTVHSALCIGFDLVSLDGTAVFRSYQTDLPDGRPLELQPGRNVLRCVIPPALLNAGEYAISPRIGLHFMKWIAQEDAAVTFEVVFDHGASAFLAAGARPGGIAPLLEWSHAEERAGSLG